MSASLDWMSRGACAGTDRDLFFPAKTGGQQDARKARQVCWSCPVLAECREYAMADATVHGIWGGTTDKDRARHRREVGYTRRTDYHPKRVGEGRDYGR